MVYCGGDEANQSTAVSVNTRLALIDLFQSGVASRMLGCKAHCLALWPRAHLAYLTVNRIGRKDGWIEGRKKGREGASWRKEGRKRERERRKKRKKAGKGGTKE